MKVNWGDLPTWIATAAALIALIVTYWNGHDKSKAQMRTIFAAILQIEAGAQSLRLNVSHAKLQLELENAKRSPNQRIVEALETEYETCVVLYLNAADRLAYCVMQSQPMEDQLRVEYRHQFAAIISDFSEHFGPNCVHRHIREFHDRCQRA